MPTSTKQHRRGQRWSKRQRNPIARGPIRANSQSTTALSSPAPTKPPSLPPLLMVIIYTLTRFFISLQNPYPFTLMIYHLITHTHHLTHNISIQLKKVLLNFLNLRTWFERSWTTLVQNKEPRVLHYEVYIQELRNKSNRTFSFRFPTKFNTTSPNLIWRTLLGGLWNSPFHCFSH